MTEVTNKIESTKTATKSVDQPAKQDKLFLFACTSKELIRDELVSQFRVSNDVKQRFKKLKYHNIQDIAFVKLPNPMTKQQAHAFVKELSKAQFEKLSAETMKEHGVA